MKKEEEGGRDSGREKKRQARKVIGIWEARERERERKAEEGRKGAERNGAEEKGLKDPAATTDRPTPPQQ